MGKIGGRMEKIEGTIGLAPRLETNHLEPRCMILSFGSLFFNFRVLVPRVPHVPHVPHFVAQTIDFVNLDQFPSKLEHVGFKGVLKILIKNFDSKNDSWPQTGLHAKFQPNLTIFRIF